MDRKNFFQRNALSLVFLLLFILSLIGQSFAGWQDHNQFLSQFNRSSIGFGDYFLSGHFISATFENWESEFFQMGLFVIITIFLKQEGSSESRPFGEENQENELLPKKDSPSVVKKGGWRLFFYSHSLSIVLFTLFVFSFMAHWYGSWLDENEELMLRNQPGVEMLKHLSSSRFWFESFQNWQSEFLSVFALVFLSIYLRQKGSPQSKKVNDAHAKTGE